MTGKPEPPDEDKWGELGLYDRCTCYDYNWPLDECPLKEIYPDEDNECYCCPYHHQECFNDI